MCTHPGCELRLFFQIKDEDIERPSRGRRSLLLVVGRDQKERVERTGTIVKAALYAVQVFYSFFIM